MALRIKKDTPQGQRIIAVDDYLRAREAADRADEWVKKAEARLLAVLEEQGVKSTTLVKDNIKYTTTVTSRTQIVYDEPGLKKALGYKAFEKLTTPKLDRAKLSAAIDEGRLDPSVVAQHSTVNPGARSVRLTRKVADDEHAEEA